MDNEQARFNMVEQQIRPCDVNNKEILALFRNIGREKFVPNKYKELAFSDLEIPLPGGQSMLNPRLEALLLQNLSIFRTDKVLEIGTGSGYVTALLARMADFVYSIEINEQNKQLAAQNLTYAGINNVSLIAGDGINGLAGRAPFDRILIGGGMHHIPQQLKSQLRIGGKLIGVFGKRPLLDTILITRNGENEYDEKKLFETNIDYLVGEENNDRFKF
ncbi:MAG: protein-L-isoaspartate O-methyltransferase [Burkholderiales bacterium]|nr:protein-L-isoaspartate O-methyltransferase [Burkholderiales bacterium]